ncbi:MAG: sensor histidine kinase [Paracoccus sp. (in: a-proteobacteria)]
MSRRWRPSLAFVLGGALAGTLVLAFAGMVSLRYLGPVIGFRHSAIVLALIITLATACLGWLLVRLLLRPIRALERYAEDREAGLEAAPPDHFGTQELHATATRVIAMAEALRDREASIRAYTDHVTHELKTPVSAIRAAVELIEDGQPLPPAEARLLGEIDAARMRIEALLAALRGAARARETRYLGQSSLAEIQPGLSADWPGLALDVRGADLPLPMALPGLELIFTHLLRNAAEHGASRVSVHADTSGGLVRVDVSDDGCGISPGTAHRVFEPFVTTRRELGGTGMGLAVVRSILKAHRGDIVLLEGGGGARLRISFAPL